MQATLWVLRISLLQGVGLRTSAQPARRTPQRYATCDWRGVLCPILRHARHACCVVASSIL